MTRVPVNPVLLRWARERTGIDQEDLAVRFKKLPEGERGETKPTLKQLEAFARAVNVPLGSLFPEEPPNRHVPIANLRTVAGIAEFAEAVA
ncbi:MAG: helix-turn-helix transcriptional regulator [Boseongicola sp. SB0664_bin_43]|uniref:Helix-turn-helix transcriptional regulator n=1 Tax=Boseongicola sp. SB0664_bin_43 TaxID=2604844 RepID=A0A6B0Y337_9RHOB|nr:helix-turn-helix transcriptional regulator [Boseongicola sp. SB0664_bin_43]MYK32905.1 helix-turn-helix transcriptional regulator [Boseongicola sp. SB0670_bin_30]